jgi:hypothetical protein
MRQTNEQIDTFIYKWLGTLLALICVFLTAFHIGYPVNIFCGFAAAILWAVVGIHWKEHSIIVINVVMSIIYGMGIIKWILL